MLSTDKPILSNTFRIAWLTAAAVWVSLPLSVSAEDLQDRIVRHHFEFVPAGSGPFPTLLAIPGCSGIALQDPEAEASHPDLREDDKLFRRHYLRISERLKDEGFAVLLIHVHGAEGLLTACRGEIEGKRIAEYIDAAIAWARSLSFVDPSRIYLIGWSMGGGGVLAWLHGARNEEASVRSAISVYPGCSDLKPLTSQVPLLLLLGGADDIADPARCEEVVNASNPKSGIQLHRYDGARHGFDIVDAPSVLEIGGGMTIGHQQAAAQASWQAILSFLSEFRNGSPPMGEHRP